MTDANKIDEKLEWILNKIDVIYRRQEFLSMEPYERRKVIEFAEKNSLRLPAEFHSGLWAARYLEWEVPIIFFAHRSADVYVSHDIITKGQWEPILTQFIRRDLDGKSGTFIDVGANIGWFSLLAARGLDLIDVIAIEPEHKNLSILRANIDFNRYSNIEVIASAVSDTCGKATLHLAEVNQGDHQINADNQWRETSFIDLITLDSLRSRIKSNVKWIKIDVQGVEASVILGSKEIIKEYRPLIFVELWIEKITTQFPSVSDFKDYLDKYGYEACVLDNVPRNELKVLKDISSLAFSGVDIVLRPRE